MSPIKCSTQMYEKFTAKKLVKLVKVVKPVLKLMRRKARTNAVTPSTCNYDIVESVQNDMNELELFQLDFKFLDEESNEADENLKNELLEKQLLETEKLVPASFVDGEITWMSRSDFDICKRGHEYVTCQQRAEQQV